MKTFFKTSLTLGSIFMLSYLSYADPLTDFNLPTESDCEFNEEETLKKTRGFTSLQPRLGEDPKIELIPSSTAGALPRFVVSHGANAAYHVPGQQGSLESVIYNIQSKTSTLIVSLPNSSLSIQKTGQGLEMVHKYNTSCSGPFTDPKCKSKPIFEVYECQ